MHHNQLFSDFIQKTIDTFMIFIKTKSVAGNTVTRSFTKHHSNLWRESDWERTICITANFVT